MVFAKIFLKLVSLKKSSKVFNRTTCCLLAIRDLVHEGCFDLGNKTATYGRCASACDHNDNPKLLARIIDNPRVLRLFFSGWSPGDTLGNSNIIYIFLIRLFRVTTYCFAPEFLAHFSSIVPKSLQANR